MYNNSVYSTYDITLSAGFCLNSYIKTKVKSYKLYHLKKVIIKEEKKTFKFIFKQMIIVDHLILTGCIYTHNKHG